MSKFELFKDKNKEWRWNLKASNGEVIATSEGYSSESAARKGIKSVRKNALIAKVVKLKGE